MSTEPKLVTAEKPRGFADKLGEEAGAEERIVTAVGRVFEKWGFDRLETPAIEYTGALGKFLPDTDRPNEGVFSFQDDERWLSLRYDLTAPLARFAAENRDALPKPFRRWQTGPVWRNEKPGPGRFRQFVQCDADTVGSDSPAADAEIVAMAGEALEAIGVSREGYQFKINSRRILNGVLLGVGAADDKARLTVMRAIDKLDRVGVDGVAALLGTGRKDESGDFTPGANLDPASVKKVIDFVTLPTDSRAAVLSGLERIVGDNDEGKAGLKELAGIDAVLSALGVGDARARIDPSVVRGLEYYTGAVYEAELTATVQDESGRLVRFGSVGGGGRYDDLIARFTGERVPATGFSIGVSRLIAAQRALGLGGAHGADPLVIVLAMDRERMGDYFAIAGDLRAGGVRAEVYLGGAGMKAQLKYADKRDARIAVIQGGDELAKGVVTLKDLKLGAEIASKLGEDREAYAKAREQVQREVPRAEVVAAVQQMLAR
ncbi:MAG TPA: histidine--tRNA ligase [Vitreimonas sp.]|uniref:histidine--tRNA ligase n=1 Tax=Vitreimonas sp. TaxID=3069702 RepID=UPI002D3313C7|nr:histidine--tRNA ligase [Vitreimonas sp.]HYD86500.1 histidine--tRNA ligase [Vitreimonas sp.]